MPDRKIPQNIRPLFDISAELPEVSIANNSPQEIDDRKGEAQRVLKRLHTIIEEHRVASQSLNVAIDAAAVSIIIAALRDHAKGGRGELQIDGDDEIYRHCLQRLFEELVEEPSNILYTTQTSQDSVRYDAMNASFWIECLDLLQQSFPTE